MINKLTKTVLPAIVILLIFQACNMGNSPSKSASKFLNAFNEKDYNEARKYATEETIKLVDLMESLSKMSTSIDSIQHKKIEVVSEKIEGESAIVTFREAGSDETEDLNLKKIDGKWLVHITKTDISSKENSVFNTEEEGIMMESTDSSEVPADSSNQLNSK
jgi:hypothetical protein